VGKISPLYQEHITGEVIMADRYYKKPNGTVTKLTLQHDAERIFKRYVEVDKNGNELKKVKKAKKVTKKVKK
jgi:prophage tail gpP-like protein